ncbi:MAG: CRISPR-associated ring nuclease Csm6 [Nitrococcus sp.]|nr:CRISPR-associated ring nuclease Csm6 [Nitrococcus sp.]
METADPSSALHLSLVGGRKSMGFYAGYGLSLLGREQDELSHVLVSPPFESNREFFYPARDSRIIFTDDADRRPLDASEAEIILVRIPFVRLRHGLPEPLFWGRMSFSEAVAAVQASLDPAVLDIDLVTKQVTAAGRKVHLPRSNARTWHGWRCVASRIADRFARRCWTTNIGTITRRNILRSIASASLMRSADNAPSKRR